MWTLFFKPTVMTGSISLSLSVWCSITWEPGQTHYPLRKLCTLCHLIPELYPVSLSIFLSLGLGAQLCAALVLARCLFGLLVWDRLSWETLTDSRTVISPLLHSQPTACLQLPACLQQLSTPRGRGTLNYFGHKQQEINGARISSPWKREVEQKGFSKYLVKYFREQTLQGREIIVGLYSEQGDSQLYLLSEG